MKTNAASKLRVGLLIVTALVILAVTILLMGKERRLFENKVPFEIHFSRTNGLRVGAPISLTGVTVGSVESIGFPQDVHKNYVVVQIRVVGEAASRVRKDMSARVRTQGLLGDKFIELSGGSIQSERLRPGGLIPSINPIDYEALLGESSDLVQDFTEATNSFKNILKSIEEGEGLLGQLMGTGGVGKSAEIGDNLRAASASLKNILGSIEKGKGPLGQLVQGGETSRAMLENLRAGLQHFRGATESLEKTAEKIAKGEGTLGTLIQDPNAGKEILTSLRRSAANLESITRELRQGEGILQRLVTDRHYAERVLTNLERTTEDLAQIAGKIDRGEGTLGALVNDPKLYDDAKEVLTDAKGSWLFSISRFFRNLLSSPDEPAQRKTPRAMKEEKE